MSWCASTLGNVPTLRSSRPSGQQRWIVWLQDHASASGQPRPWSFGLGRPVHTGSRATNGRRSSGSPVLDPKQLQRIEATHRGFGYQHLYGVACLLSLGATATDVVIIEHDEDVELVRGGTHIYVHMRHCISRPIVIDRSSLTLFPARPGGHSNSRRLGMQMLVGQADGQAGAFGLGGWSRALGATGPGGRSRSSGRATYRSYSASPRMSHLRRLTACSGVSDQTTATISSDPCSIRNARSQPDSQICLTRE